MTQLGQFEQNLLTELREVVAERNTVPPPRSRKRLVLAAAGGGLLATGLLVGIPAMNGDQTPAAYAVTTNDDGTVTVTITQVRDAEGLERELEAHDIAAEVDYAPPGKMCQRTPPRYVEDEIRHTILAYSTGPAEVLTLRPTDFTGKTLVIESAGGPVTDEATGTQILIISTVFTSGPVAPCVLVDAPTA